MASKETLYDKIKRDRKLMVGDYYIKVRQDIITNHWNGKDWLFPMIDYHILQPVPSYGELYGLEDGLTQKALRQAELRIKHLTRVVKKQHKVIMELQK